MPHVNPGAVREYSRPGRCWPAPAVAPNSAQQCQCLTSAVQKRLPVQLTPGYTPHSLPTEPNTVLVDPADGSRCLTVSGRRLVTGARVCFDTCQPGTPRDEQVFQFVRCPAGGSILSVTQGGQDLCVAFSASGQGLLAECDCEDPSQVVGFDGSTYVDSVAGPRGACKIVLGGDDDATTARCVVPAVSCAAPLLGNCTAPRASLQCLPTSGERFWGRVGGTGPRGWRGSGMGCTLGCTGHGLRYKEQGTGLGGHACSMGVERACGTGPDSLPWCLPL